MSFLSQSILGGQPAILPNPLDQYDPTSPYAGYLGYSANAPATVETYDPYRNPRVNYADPAPASAGPLGGQASDLLQLDPDPFGTRTAKWAADSGVEIRDGQVMSLDVFGRRMSREQLSQSDAGSRLLQIAERRRKGQKRGFLDAIMDWSWEDAPFVSLFATVGKSVSDAVVVSDTFKKLQNGLPVTDDELLKTRLYMAESEEKENGSWGATVADIMRAAPGFMAEFFVTGGLYSLARTGLAKLGKEGVHLAFTRATKIAAREAMQEAAEKQVAKMAAKGAEGFVKLGADEAAKKSVIREVADSVFKHTMKDNPMYQGLADDVLESMARSRAEYEFGKMMARNAGGKIANGLNTFSQWLGQNVSRGLMDFGSWGTEESTVLFTARSKATQALADAVGTFLVDAPLKGALMWAPNQFLARPLVGMALGQDGRTVSSAQLGLEAAAYMSGNRELMANAESMSHGLSLLEYVSENTGRGLTSLMRAAGIGLEKAGVKGLVRPATRALGVAEDTTDAVSLGGKMRQWVKSVFGSRDEYRKKTTAAKVAAVARKVGATADADVRAIETAVLSGSTDGLRAEIAGKIGPDVGKFAAAALKEMGDAERAKLGYKTFGKFMFADWMARHQVGPETVMNMFDKMGYDGVLGEMFEERYSDFAKGLFGWDDRTDHDIWSNLKTAIKNLYPGWDQLTAEAVAFMMPMVARAGILRVQAAVAGGEGEIRKVQTRLAGIRDAFRVGTVTEMTPGEYMANHQRTVEQDETEIARMEEKRKLVQESVDGAVQVGVDEAMADPRVQASIERRARRQGRKARRQAIEAGMSAEQADQAEKDTYESAKKDAVRRSSERYAEIERKRLTRPGGTADRVSQLDEDIARARKVLERRKEMYDKFMASVPEAAVHAAEEIVVPIYTADDLADDTRFNRTPALTASQAGEAMAGRNAMVDYAPELGRRLVEAESRMEGEDPSWWRRAAHRIVGVAGALVTGDFSMAALNPVQWTARDMGLSRHVVDGLKKNMREWVGKARDLLGGDREKLVGDVARLRGEADRAREKGDEARAAQLEREAAALEAAPANGRPTDKDVYDLAERLAAPSAKRIMAANLAVHHLRSFTKEQARDQAMGIVGKELGYEWYADKDGTLRFFKYKEGGREVDESTVVDAAAFYEANRERVDKTKKDLVAATVDVLSRRLTRSGDDSIRLLNAVSLPNPSELREMAQARTPGAAVTSDAVMREAALYDAAARMIGAGDLVERVRIDGSVPLAEVLDRGALGRVNMATVDYLARFEKAEDVPEAGTKAFEALAWSLSYPFDGTEKGLAERNRKLFAIAKLASHFNRDDKAFYSKPTAIDDEEASRLTPNGNIPLSATRVGDKWVVDMGRDVDGKPDTREFATREEMDAAMREDGYRPDMSRLVLTLAQAVESTDMFGMLRELGLAPRYQSLLTEANLHPMLRKDADGRYIDEDEAQRILRAELAAAEGGKTAPKDSRARKLWERVWGDHGYMKVGERLLRDNGVEKSVVSKYAGEFSDYSPPVYTLQLSAGRLSPTSANVYVPVDPLVCPDVVSGVVNGLLIQAFLTHPRLLMNKMGSVLSEFVAQLRGVIDMVSAATEDKELKADLERFRREVAADVDKAVMTDEGLVYRKGLGMTASSYATLASAFVLGRESDYAENPHLRAVATLAPYVRMCPAFTDFCDVVDLTLGGAGPISAASRIATKAEEDVADQRGLQRVMSFAAADPKAMEKKLKEMRPLGLDPVKFLDLCARRLAALAKSGAPAVPEKEMQDLRDQASAAQANPTPKAHLTFYGHLFAVVKRMVETDVPVDPAVRDFVRDLAETAQDEPGVTEAQKDGLRKMLGMLTRVGVVGKAREKYENAVASYSKAFDETLDAYSRRQELKKVIDETSKAIASVKKEITRAEARNEAADMPVRWAARQQELADMQRKMTELKALRKRLWETETKARKAAEAARTATEGAQTELRAAEGAGNTSDLAANNTVVAWMDRTLNAMAPADEGAPEATDFDNKDQETDTEQDATDDDPSIERTDAMELPESVALGEDKTVMSHGFTEVPVEMERSVQRLCVNVCVRSVAMRAAANADPNADPLDAAVTEDSVVAMAKELFHLSDREADALRLQYRLADDARMRSNRTWEDFARSGVRWEFQEDDKADDDVSSDNFMNRAAAEYNSPFLADALALAARVAPESGTNLRAFIARTKEWLRRSGETMVTPGVTTEVGGVPIVWEQSSDGHVSAAWYDPKDGTIHVHAEGIRGKYASGAWKSPERSSIIPGADSLIRSADDLVAWAVYHELGHARDKTPRVATEASRIAREDRANAFASRHLARAKRQAAIGFAMSLLDPRLDRRGKTQAEQSALHMRALALFDESPETVAAHVASMLAPDESGKFPTSRRLAFLLSYMAALPTEDRRNFALLCANSVSAQATHVATEYVDGERVQFVAERRVGAGDKVSDRIVGDTFVHVLEGRDASEAQALADELRKVQAEILEQFPNSQYPGKVAGQIIGRVFGRESPLVTALASDAASEFRTRRVKNGDKAQQKLNKTLLESVTPVNGLVPIVESIAATLEALAARGEPLTSDNVTAAFVALFETGRPDKEVGVRRLENGPSITNPLKAWLSSYCESLPATIMSAEVDQRRDSSGSSVPIAPRDSVPMVSRWIYSDEKAKGVIDGRVVEFPTFEELARQAFPNATDAQIERCRQDACWPDGTPVCAKNTSSSLTTRELYLACEKAYQMHRGDAWYIPLYAGDHSSATMLRIPWSVKMDGFMKAAQAPADRTDLVRVSFPEGNSHKGKDEKKFNQLGGLTKFIGFGTGSTGLYAKALAAIANKETYTKDDIVGVSVNGKRPDRVPVRGTDVERLVRAAAQAGATIIADEEKNRTDYNLGERELVELLRELGYSDTNGNGVWRPIASTSGDESKYRRAARAMSYAVGMNLMYTDTKRSAVTSLENQGAGLIGVKDPGNLDEAAQKVAGTAAVGPDGKPLLLYHGSSGPIAAFENRNGYGTWFTNVRSQAVQFSWKAQGEPRRRSRNPNEWIPKQDLSKTNVQSFYLNIRNPKVYEPSTGTYGDAYYAFLKDFQEATGAKGKNWDTPPDQAKKFADALKAQGYDGFVIRGTMVDDEVEDQWVAFDPQQIVEAKPPEYGEHRVHIIHNWAFEREGYTFKKAGKNEALLGTTRMYGYGARTMKTLSKDRKSDLLKLHLISTSGHDLFFIKSLSVAVPEDKNDGFLEDSMNGVIDAYARKFRGDDRNSTDTYTDDDSYKIGVGNSKAILVQTADGKTQKLKDWLFSRLRDACGAPKDASEDEVAAKFKSTYGKLTGDALDELVGDVQIVDLARTDGSEPTPMKLSELMPGVMVNAVEGLDGPCLDLSYREDGAMAYTVANVSHPSKVSNEPGRTPRNYEMDMIAAATMLSTFGAAPYTLADKVARDAYDLVANWGLVAACAYATKPQRDAAAARSVAVENLRLNGEHPDGQNVRSEVARAVWAQVRENANIPVKGVDAALVACGASVDDNNRLMAHTKSRMLLAMMRGAEIFTPEEQAFFGKRFRHALCNVNMSAPGFRHAWFLDRARFDALDAKHKTMTDREVATVLAAMFEEARKKAEDAKGAPKGPERKAAEAALLDAKKELAGLFVDHHGIPIWSEDPSESGHTEKYVKQFHLADLFGADGKFDMSALQLDGDKVHNDATGQEHILLGGTKFGFPRTPSYNAHYETVRAGLPVKEARYVNADGQTRWRVSHDAMVSPDPYTNKILGTDHDGDKSKLYLLHTDAYGLADERVPPEPEGDGVLAGLAANSTVKVGDREVRARDAYVLQLSAGEWLERVWINPETGKEEPVPEGETPEGMYHRVSDRAKLAVSNAFVRTMFEISDSVPTLGMDGKERVSETPANRVKCLGGIAFRPVSTQPVLTDTAWKAIAANATAPVLGEREETRPDGTKVKVKETVGDPWKAAEVSASAEDADGARGTIVALARTLHVAFASGQFSGLFGGQPTGMQWLAFLNHFDGLSNATFDDIKEQICGRLGWTKGMMDTVIVELLSSTRRLPTTDKEWSKILGDYARNVKEGRAEYWMLKASSVEEDEFVDKCRGILGVETLSKENLQAAMGVEFDANTKHWRPTGKGTTPLSRVMSTLYGLCKTDAQRAGFDYLVTSANGKLGHNSTLGRLAYLVSGMASLPSNMTQDEMSRLDMVRDTIRWATKRAQLDEAQKFERSVNYLTADPGDASKFAKYGSEEEAVVLGGETATGEFGEKITDAAFAKMEIATGMMYRAAGNLATVEASAMLAAYRRDENLKELYKTDPDAARFLFVKDALPRWDRLGLTANRQQLPYLMSFFCRQASIAANVKDTLFTDANKLYGAVAAMAARVASYADPVTREPKYGAVGKGLAARVAIESLFSIMYKLMTTSTEFADGNTLPAYLRAPKDSEFDEKNYGKIGTRLLRIMPGYRSNDREAHERVRAMYDAIVRGEAYVKPRVGNWENRDAEGTDCRRFSLSRKSLRAYMIEQLRPEHRQKFRLDTKWELALKDARATEPERADVWDEIEDAGNALLALEKFLLGKPDPDKELAITPAMMFGQLLPLYSLMTSRCLGAPEPSSPSILALAPSWLYEEISAGEAELSARAPELVSSVVAGNWAPYLENVRKTGKKLKRKDGKWQEVEVGVKDVDALAATADFSENGNGDVVLPKQPDATDAAEQRDNPDWRTTVDIFSDGAFKAALKAAGPSRAPAVPASAPAPGPAPRGAGAYDETTARVAGALGLALGTWATVEYVGGKTFVVRGKLRGTMGQGKNVVFTVDMDGKLCDTDAQVEALADSEAYGASLAECADIGIRSGQDFMRLPRDTRIALVKRYGVGGVTMHHVDWKFDGKGVATLVGAIRLGKSKADTTVFHEYFHGMMRVFDAIGLFSEEDKAALRKTFGEPTKKGQWFNEERAAESFRKWVEGKMDPQARERRGIFRKIYDALKGILLAIRRGFGYTDDTDKNMELLFDFVAHGVAQASESRVAEISASQRMKVANVASLEVARWSDVVATEAPASALEAAYLARNDVAVATAIAQIVPPPAIENAKVSTERLRSDNLARELEAKLKSPATQAADLKETLASLVDVRTEIARAMGREILQVDEPLTLDTDTVGDQYLDFMPGSAESVVQDTRDAVKAVTTPVAATNDFYRAANFIHEAMERGLESEGSWRAPLQDIVRRYGTPSWNNGVAENLDKAVLLHGLRNALEAVNPGASRALDDQKLRDSLVFQAALSMYHGFDSWAHSKNKDATPIPPEPGSEERVFEATQYDVSGWILSTRPLSAAETVRQALDLTEAAMDRDDATGPVKAELKRHRDALRKVLDAVDDQAGLMALRRGELEAVFDEAFAMLREGTKLNGHARDGRLNDITPGDVAELQAEGKTRALRRLDSFQNTHRVPMVQESLKSALEALWQTAAQAKFYTETDVVPATPEGMEFAQQMMLRHNTPHATPAEYAASQAIGDSNLVDNRPLVDFYCQPAFIANNVDAWLRSLVRNSFGARGNIGEMLSAENREYSAFKMRIADLENFYSLLAGTNVEDGGFLLKVEEVQGKWAMRYGEVVREDGKTYFKIDNYRRKPTKIRLSEADLRVIDLYLKSISAYAVRQDRVVTGMDRLWFSPADFDHDWSREAIARKWNDGKPTAHMTPMEMTLMRLDTQFPPDVLDGAVDLRGRIVRKAEAELAAIRADAEARGEEPNPATVNRRVLRALRSAGLLETNGDTSFGVVTIPTDDLNRMFLESEAYRKLTSAERGVDPAKLAELLDRDRIARDFMEVYRDAVRFARKHAWVVHGDGQYFSNFGTTLPFWRGDGVFMYNCNRVERDARQAAEDEMTATEKALYRTMSEEDVDTPLHELEYAAYSELLDRTGEAYGVHAPGVRFAKDVADGRYEDGQELSERTKLVLPKDATKADLAHALYRKALEDVHLMATGAKADGLRSAENIIRMYEDSKLERGELFAGTCGLNDLDVYRLHGVKPANAQIGHKVHLAIDGITNAMMHRATLANLLMTPAADGAPMYYADPSDYATDTSGLPDEFWANVARWWAEWNKVEYDAKLSGVQNAKRIYAMVHETRKRNQGKIGENEYARTYSELSGDDAKDCMTVERWLVRDDDRSFEESSVLNSVAGGEAMGYLKQFVQAGRTLGFGGNMARATLHRALSWSKSMSVAFSLFFPLATKWESPIGAVGATATIMSNMRRLGNFLREHPDLANMLQKAVGGKGWITQNFLGFNDIIEMMDTNDPFLAELKAWAAALGVTLSSSLVNPMEETKSVMTEDLRWLKERVRDRMGAKAAGKFGRIVEAVVTRGGDKAFNYALNATKLAVVAQMCMKLRHAAQRKGKAFDPVRDLRRYSRYINAEVGGIDPLQYAWATPLNRGIMNTLLFSWQWTRGAWEAGGGGVIEDFLLGGHNMTREEREYIVGRWARMFGTVMIGVPALMQCLVMALAKAMGGGDDENDRWATWQNEDKTKWTAFDLTPLLRAIERFDDTKLGGVLRSFKRNGAAATGTAGAAAGALLGRMNGGNMFTAGLGGVLGAVGGSMVPTLVPMYTGEDPANRTSRARRYYMHFGKQGWEFFRWFEDAKGQFFSKLSMPTQRILEGIMGRNLSYLDRALPWDEMGQFERWLSPTTDGALFNLAQAFLPFSLGGVSRTGDAGFLPIVGPVQMGASQTNVQDRLVKALTAWARNDRTGYRYGGASRTKASKLLAERVPDILRDARINGLDPETQLNKAYGQVATKLYGELIDLIPDDPKGDFDVRAVERAARAINRVGAKKAQVLKSLKTRVEGRLKARGLSWNDLPAEDRARYAQAVQAGVGNPFGTYDY